jgi:hypothetical protein
LTRKSNLNQTPYCDHRHVPFVLLKVPTAPKLLCHVHLCWNSCEALNYVPCTVTTNVIALLQIPIHIVWPVVQYGFYIINKSGQRLFFHMFTLCLYQWPRGLRRRSTATRLLRLRVRIPPESWMFLSCECYVLSGGSHFKGPIVIPEESYRVCVCVCDREASTMRRPWPTCAVEP